MPEKSIDRRVRRTRSALQDALISLILEKGYDTVTIEEITERADLGRTTFYLHFRAKEELLLHAIDTICEDFLEKNRALMALVDITKGSLQPSSLILDEGPLFQIFAHARENADLYKVMMRGEGGAMASQRFGNIIKEEVVKRLSQVKKLAIKVPLEVFAIYFSKTLMGLVTWWLENNQPYPIEIMVQYFQQMFFLGAINTLNIPHEKLQIDLVN
jgi:AcrR family transcriptional regulator